MRELLKEYPVVIEFPVAWGEMDVLGHVNNVVYFRYFESARVAYFRAIRYSTLQKETGLGPILGATGCRFRIPLTYPDTVWIGATVPEVGEDRFVMRYCVVSADHRKVAAEGEGLIVSYDYRQNRRAVLPEAVRERIATLQLSGGGSEAGGAPCWGRCPRAPPPADREPRATDEPNGSTRNIEPARAEATPFHLYE
ncbi:MAG: acyl-CoA thioesterase [Deltaproteobacteria bacterium]|nr:acyl-CoA thioesterase [Deltaproteobacteria bacterium]